MTYDEWKTTEPDDQPWAECDCCGRRGALRQMWAFGNLETWACDGCCGDEPRDEGEAA